MALLSNRDNFFAHEALNFTLCDRLLDLSTVAWSARFQQQVAVLKRLFERAIGRRSLNGRSTRQPRIL
jgi:hypothetical protein